MVRLSDDLRPKLWETVVEVMEDALKDLEFEGEDIAVNWLAGANARRLERELYERYGIFKDVILHPYFQAAKQILEENVTTDVLLGDPLMPTVTIVVILCLLRGRLSYDAIALAAAFLFNVNPLYVVLLCGAYFFYNWVGLGKSKPLQYVARTRADLLAGAAAAAAAKVVEYSEEQQRRKEVKMEDEPMVFDHVIIGGEIGALYTAALLSRVGHKCCVLKPQGALPMEVQVEGSDCPIPTRNCTIGKVERYQSLLDMVQSGSKCGSRSNDWRGDGRVAFTPVGTPDNLFMYTLLKFNGQQQETLGERAVFPGTWPLRAGQDALGRDLANQSMIPDQTEFCKYLQHLSQTQQENLTSFLSTRVAPSSPFAVSFTPAAADVSEGGAAAAPQGNKVSDKVKAFLDLASKPIEQLLSNTDPALHVVLRGAAMSSIDEISIKPSECSSFALAHFVASSEEGIFYPIGGCKAVEDALLRTIVSAGGVVMSDVPIDHILLQDEGQGRVAKGVVLQDQQQILAKRTVVSGTGMINTYAKLVSKEDLPEGIPYALNGLCEAKPKVMVLFWIKASEDEAKLSPSDLFELGDAYLDGQPVRPDFSRGSMRIWSPSAKDPSWQSRHPETQAVVVELEAGEPFFSLENVSDNKGPRIYAFKSLSKEQKDKAEKTALAYLKEIYPSAAANVEFTQVIPPTVDGQFISQSTAKYCAPLSAISSINGLYFCGRDLGTSGLAGEMQGGWVAANAVLGYTPKHLEARRSVISDLHNVGQ